MIDTVQILVIGNDTINLQTIKNSLLEFGEDWLIMHMTCENARLEVDKTKFNLIIIDYIDDLDTIIKQINCLKNSTKNHHTPIITCIQETSSYDIENIIKAGTLDYVKKPFQPIELFARVRTGLTLSSSIDKIEIQSNTISENQHKIEDILTGIIPKEIINELNEFGESKPKKYREASVIFVDLVDFTRKSKKLTPKIIIKELSEIFSGFNKIISQHKCTRIKTMGDGYLAVSGIPTPNSNHAINLIKAAIEMRKFISMRNNINSVKWDLKIGINSGEVIGSVLENNYLFDVFGDTVNEASRMEKVCEPNQINISHNSYLISQHLFKFIERLPAAVKGLGVKKMYYLKSQTDTLNPRKRTRYNSIKLGKNIEKLAAN